MSDSYVIGRIQAEAKRRKPPKKPRWQPAIWPWYCLAYIMVHFAVAYGVASSDHKTGNAIGFGLALFWYGHQLWVWWQWRQWSRYTGSEVPDPIPHRGATFVLRAIGVAVTGYLLVGDLLDWFVNGRLPGQ